METIIPFILGTIAQGVIFIWIKRKRQFQKKCISTAGRLEKLQYHSMYTMLSKHGWSYSISYIDELGKRHVVKPLFKVNIPFFRQIMEAIDLKIGYNENSPGSGTIINFIPYYLGPICLLLISIFCQIIGAILFYETWLG